MFFQDFMERNLNCMTIPSSSKKAQLNWIVPDHFLVFFGTNKSGYDLLRAKS